jgi:hydrogenase maturation protease
VRLQCPRILIAGIGNIFLGDDAFGPEVASRLARRPLAEGIRSVDFGTSGFDLIRALISGCDAAILLHATPQGDEPGTLSSVEWERVVIAQPDSEALLGASRAVDPLKALQLAAAMGAQVKQVLLVRCEPEPRVSNNETLIGMSDAVRSAVDRAVELVESLVVKLRAGERLSGRTVKSQ